MTPRQQRYKIVFEFEAESLSEAQKVAEGVQAHDLTPTGHRALQVTLQSGDSHFRFPSTSGLRPGEAALYDLMLDEPGGALIAVIKEIRGLTNLGLKEAKDLVDSTRKHNPSALVLKDLEEGLAQKALETLENVGAQAHIERSSLTEEEIKKSITKLLSTEQELAS